ncbi:MAG TPA: hypothetical protein DCM54_15855 [Gammaproteobacteria bacterium]|nr:hypothetical protein [Gammaproteobacteria bacterium]
MNDKNTPVATSGGVNKFLSKVAATPVRKSSTDQGKLIFAMDATASREPTWDRACHLQSEMFNATDSLGGLSIQLCYYRGFAEFKAHAWCDSRDSLLAQMSDVRCRGGYTQIHRVLTHGLSQPNIQAIVFVGDAIEENSDALCQLAGKLGLINVPLFMFQEGTHPQVQSVFRQMARLSGGAYAPFDLNSANELRQLLSAVAIYAAGGQQALQDFSQSAGTTVKQITRQMKE